MSRIVYDYVRLAIILMSLLQDFRDRRSERAILFYFRYYIFQNSDPDRRDANNFSVRYSIKGTANSC